MSFAFSFFESGMDRAARLALEILISSVDKMTYSRKMRIAERFSR